MFKSISKILVAPLIIFFIHLVFMFVIPVYRWYPPIDNFIHFFGGVSIFIASLVAISILTNKQKIPILPLWLILTLSFTLTVTIGVLWEFFEFSSDYLFKTTMQLSSTDTMSDLFFDCLGSLMVICVYYLKTKKSFLKERIEKS